MLSGHSPQVFQGDSEVQRLSLSGRLGLDTAIELQGRIRDTSSPLVVDLTDVSSVSGAGAALLLQLVRRRPDDVKFVGASEDIRGYLQELPAREVVEAIPLREAMEEEPFLVTAGAGWMDACDSARQFTAGGLEFLYWVFVAPFRGQRLRVGRTATEINRVGIDAIPIVGLISILIGVILALNAASQLVKYGAQQFTADLVGIALARELAPVITAVLIAGRSGSAIAAEVATMVVTEEIDALRVMGVNPRSYLIVPKLLALTLTMPCLVILSLLLGISGGFLVALTVLGLPFDVYWDASVRALSISDVLLGMAKAVVFGLLIGLTASTLGMKVQGGAAGVGRVTTSSVVVSFFLVIVFNALFTSIFYWMGF